MIAFKALLAATGAPPLRDGGDDLNDIALANLVDAPTAPGLADLPAKEPSDLATGAILIQPLGNERLQQILDALCYDPSFRLPFLACRIAAFELGRQHLLRRHSRLMKGHAPIRPNGVLAQLRARTAGAVENDEYLTAFRRNLDPEAGTTGVPVDNIRFRSRKRVDRALRESNARHRRWHPSSGCYLHVT